MVWWLSKLCLDNLSLLLPSHRPHAASRGWRSDTLHMPRQKNGASGEQNPKARAFRARIPGQMAGWGEEMLRAKCLASAVPPS